MYCQRNLKWGDGSGRRLGGQVVKSAIIIIHRLSDSDWRDLGLNPASDPETS